jgi:hypothetical protein
MVPASPSAWLRGAGVLNGNAKAANQRAPSVVHRREWWRAGREAAETRLMDSTEAVARRFLTNCGFVDPVFEPDGRCPPDFLVAGSIAVEVRRLNQNVSSGKGYEGLENVTAALLRGIGGVLEGFGPPKSGKSWWVHYTFRRPIDKWPLVRRHLNAFLSSVLEKEPSDTVEQQCGHNLRVTVAPTEADHPLAFMLGGYLDQHAGGWVTSEMISNVALCVDYKTKKVRPYLSKYPTWWLVLVDRTGMGATATDLAVLPDHLSIADCWERVVIIDPVHDHRVFWLK